ncbi:class I SAM-dependent methyltransferase [Amphibacillus sp. Q70]|uniref:class I SAM-dependent methyltransferase n=1 Tax=Amphibacillus sp. Q70 TaxID=3453416 RepID=UPI003F871C58
MFEEYGELSTKLYQHTKPVGHSIDGDIEYYGAKLKERKGSVLEAGVGTGRMLIPFLKEGIEMDGVDLSSDMLNQCKINMEHHQVNTNLFQQDLTQLALERKYKTIIMPTGSFCLLPSDKMDALLHNLFSHLEDGGQFIFDTIFPADFRTGQVEVRDYSLTSESGIVFTNTSQAIDWLKQSVSYINKYELLSGGTIEKTEISHFVLNWYGLKELELRLKQAGFSTIQYEVGYGKDSHSSVATFIADKVDKLT